ncbi:hypothetical protein Droror1_Dr00021900 [Drosera rotundifolia]
MAGPGGILLLPLCSYQSPNHGVCEHRRAQTTRVKATEKDECFGVPYPTAENQPIVSNFAAMLNKCGCTGELRSMEKLSRRSVWFRSAFSDNEIGDCSLVV